MKNQPEDNIIQLNNVLIAMIKRVVEGHLEDLKTDDLLPEFNISDHENDIRDIVRSVINGELQISIDEMS